jgi:uncharacterized membrane protein
MTQILQDLVYKLNTRSLAAMAGFVLVLLGLVLTARGLRQANPPLQNATAPTTEGDSPNRHPEEIKIMGTFFGSKMELTTGSIGVGFVFLGVMLLAIVTVAETTGMQKIRCADRAWEGDRYIRGTEFYGFVETLCSKPAVPTPAIPEDAKH